MSLSNLIENQECQSCIKKKNYQLSDADYNELSSYDDVKLSRAMANISKHKNGQTFGNIICKFLKLKLGLKDGKISDAIGIEIKNSTTLLPAYKEVRLDRDIPFYIFSWVSQDIWTIFFLSKNEILNEIDKKNISKSKTHPEATHYTLTFLKRGIKNLNNYQRSLVQLKEELKLL